MSLTNSQYNTLKREYDRLGFERTDLIRLRTSELYAKIPMLTQLDEERSLVIRDAFSDSSMDYHERLKSIADRRTKAITSAGFPADYLEPPYKCPDCKDTGFIGSEACHCFRQAAIDLIYAQSGLAELTALYNFDTFRLDIYSDNILEFGVEQGQSPREWASRAKADALEFTSHFSTGKYVNASDRLGLLLQGTTGCGKTFLTYCIAQRVMSYGCSVLYFTAAELFDTLSKSRFDHDDTAEFQDDNLLKSDLLIIDDLGSELVNKFTSSSLFDIINRRMLLRLPTVISTNLSIKELRDSYTERFNSRVLSSYKFIKLAGADLRLQKLSVEAKN